MTPGEQLARRCLHDAGGDYAAAAHRVMQLPAGTDFDRAMAALALWAKFWPLANDDELVQS